MKRIDIIYFDATSGHRSAALALEKALKLAEGSFKIRVINLVDILATQRVLQLIAKTGIGFFNWGVRHESAWFLSQQIGVFQTIQSYIPNIAIEQVSRFWQDSPPDAVVSVLPISNWLLERAVHRVSPNCPYIIIPVDFEENKKNYWFDSRIDAYYINPTKMLEKRSADIGIPLERRITVKGMPIDPLFYNAPAFDKKNELKELGLNADLPTLLVGFGGQGSVMVKRCAEKLSESKNQFNVIFLCGRHESLFQEITQLKTPYPKLVLSFSPEAPAFYYHLSDIIIGKPGSMTITEAIITKTGMVAIESNSLALVQRGNEAWLRKSGVGNVFRVEELPSAIQQMLGSTELADSIEREWHRGVFDISEIILNMANGKGLKLNEN